MTNGSFFRGIPHERIPWGDRFVPVPAFYQDVGSFGAAFLAPLSRIRPKLPSERLHPVCVRPGFGLTTITVLAYRECDIGPYNEISIGFPVTLDRKAPWVAQLLPLRTPRVMSFVLHLPVTTEFARDAGVAFYGFPKFVAGIDIDERDGAMTGRLHEGDREILSLSVQKLPLQNAPQTQTHLLSHREGKLLRCESILCEREMGADRGRGGVDLVLGDHAVADDLRALQLGRAVYRFIAPRLSLMLSPAIEGFDA
jgi:hypothetical protein